MSAPGTIEIHRPGRAIPSPPEPEVVTIEPPPAASPTTTVDHWTLIAPVGSSLGAIAFASMIGGRRYLIVAVAMAALAIGAAAATRRARTREASRLNERVRAQYLRHLDDVDQRVTEGAASQRVRVMHDHPDFDDLVRIVADRTRVWERLTHHPDFATVRIGSGRVQPDVRPQGPPRRTESTADPDLLELARSLERRWIAVDDLPIVIDLRTIACLTVVGPRHLARDLVRSIITRLAISHAPEDLPIAIRTDAGTAWTWARWLPHTRVERSAGSLRRPAETPSTATPRIPDQVVVVDESLPGSAGDIDALLGSDGGTVVIALVGEPHQTPTVTDTIVDLTGTKAKLIRLDGSSDVVRHIHPDTTDPQTAERIARSLAPLRTRSGSDAGPGSLLDHLGMGSPDPDIQGLRARARSMSAPIGVDAAGRPVWLDLREAAAGGIGPHGMLIGATGSGKSGLLRTLVTGLALGASSEELSFLLIDFKGGATFSELDRLPHVAGMVTNLESSGSLVERMRLAIECEVRRRQDLLRQAGADRVDEYRALRPRDPALEPLPDLMIVVDEFAELLAAHPDLEDTFTSIGRTGRSLGVRLLLSGQRIDEGRMRRLEAHLRYRICLKTFTPEESIAVLGSRASFDLPADPGHGHLWFDGSLVRFRAVRAHSQPPEAAPIPDGFEVVGDGEPGREPRTTIREQTDGLVARIARLDEPSRRIWLDPLPERLTMPWLASNRPLRAVIGLTDRPATREQVPAEIDFTEGSGHLGIVGMPGSGASTLMSTIICSLASGHSPDDLVIHIVDPHSGIDRRSLELPHVRSNIGRGPGGDIRGLLDHLAANRDRSATPAPTSEFLFIDAWTAFARERGPEIADRVSTIAAAGSRSGFHLVASATRWIEFGSMLRNLLTLKFELRLNLPMESEIDRRAAERVPQRLPGRGITASGELTQIALPPSDLRATGGIGTATPPRIDDFPTTLDPPLGLGIRPAIGALR